VLAVLLGLCTKLNVIVAGSSLQEHDRRLHAVLQRLTDAGLTLNMQKCTFRESSLRFLGHIISKDGILPDPDHSSAVRDAPPPHDLPSLRSFLGLISWYSKFLPNFATVVEPMRAVLRETADSGFIWTQGADQSFKELKELLLKSPVLALFDPSLPTIVILRTDHQALTTLLATKGIGRAGMRVARWSARLLCFTYDLEYRPGSQNQAADCLSRLPLPMDSTPVDEPDMVASIVSALSVAEFTSASSQCHELTLLRGQIEKGWPKCKKDVDPVLIPYFNIRNELSASRDLVMRGEHRYIVPVTLRATVIHLAHETHQGVVRTKQRLRDLYWWPQMDKMVQSVISSCTTCQMNDKSAQTAPAPLQPIELPNRPWEKVALDIVGPFETAVSSCRFAITLVDYYSKWPEVAFSHTVTTDVVIAFLRSIFSREGNPDYIVTDNGLQFLSSSFADFLRERGISHLRTSVYHPQCNGAVERWNRVFKETILTAEHMQKDWKTTVTDFLQNYRATPHNTTGVSPSELLHNRRMKTKVDIFPSPEKSRKCTTIKETVKQKQEKSKQYT
uniref:Gypsy retrotransposon integrase-like protein 1 n=1 Tax=Poecilia formosa TaxID=48698 RepID=A0A096M5I9_POEFO